MSTAVGGWLEGLKRRLTSLWKIQCPELIVLAEREMLYLDKDVIRQQFQSLNTFLLLA